MDIIRRNIVTIPLATAARTGELFTWPGSIPDYEKQAVTALTTIKTRLQKFAMGGLFLQVEHQLTPQKTVELALVLVASSGVTEPDLASTAIEIENVFCDASDALDVIRKKDRLISETIRLEVGDPKLSTDSTIYLTKTTHAVAEALRPISNDTPLKLHNTERETTIGGRGVTRTILAEGETVCITSKVFSFCDRSKRAEISLEGNSSFRLFGFPEALRTELIEALRDHKTLTFTVTESYASSLGKVEHRGGQIITIEPSPQGSLI